MKIRLDNVNIDFDVDSKKAILNIEGKELPIALGIHETQQILGVVKGKLSTLSEYGKPPKSKPEEQKEEEESTYTAIQRRTPEELEKLATKIYNLIKKNPTGLRAEDIQYALSIAHKEAVRPISKLLVAGKIKKTGNRRATKYFVV